MRHLRLAAIVLALLLLPSASAGSEGAPEIEDRQSDVRASNLDLLKAWLAPERDGVRFFVQTLDGQMPERFPDSVYWFTFHVESTDAEVAGVVGFGNDGVFRGHLGTGPGGGLDDTSVWRSNTGFERLANDGLTGLRQERGRPSTWSGVIPWGSVEGLEPGAELHGLMAGTAYYARGGAGWTGAADTASSDERFVAVLPSPLASMTGGFFPILVPAWMLPTIVLVCTAGGMGLGVLGAKKSARAAAAKVAAPKPVPVRTAPPPGSRFQRAPPAKR